MCEADSFAVPGPGHEEVAVLALDDCGVGVLAGLVFEGREHLEVLAVGADGEVERGSVFSVVVVDENDVAVAETDGVDAGVWIGKVEWVGLSPGDAVVEGVGGADTTDVRGGAGVETEMIFVKGDDGGLDDSGGVLLTVGCVRWRSR